MSIDKKHTEKSISVKHIRSPKIAIDEQLVDKFVQEIFNGRHLNPLKVVTVGYNSWNPVYELASPVRKKDALSLAVAKKARELKPSEYSHIVCYVD